MKSIRFACPKCGQHLSCEPESQGTRIVCPACKQPILVVTEEIRRCYGLLELEPGAPLNEVKQVHRERLKIWQPERFPKDPQFEKKATANVKELNEALAVITAYLTGKYSESRTGAGASADEASPTEEDEPKQRSAAGKESKSTRSATASSSSRPQGPRFRTSSILVGMGVIVMAALLVGLVVGFLNRPGPPLTDDHTTAQWIRAKERAKRIYCRAVLIQMEHKGLLRKYGLRVNDDFFYDGLESISRQQKPEDSNTKLIDLCEKLVAHGASGAKPPRTEGN